MNKIDLIAKISDNVHVSKKDAELVLNATLTSITEALANGEKVSLTGFGSFETRQRAAREGRNPRTGEVIQISAQNTPAFKAGKALKDAVK
ncbi:HU family DNA-binding protein [Mycoplasmatota bacterium]|nr:HU family DNA-binding protein [Mycoplasmatota bacterium]